MGERKATLRRTSSFMQDIVSFEPIIEQVTNKGQDLSSVPENAAEITSKYQSLSKQAKQIYEKQKDAVDHHQAFIDAGNEFMNWLRSAREKLAKCAEPTGDKDTISSKIAQITVSSSPADS